LGSKGLIGVGVELVVIGRAKSCPAFFLKEISHEGHKELPRRGCDEFGNQEFRKRNIGKSFLASWLPDFPSCPFVTFV
jgi:hypothetical protein